MTGPCESSIKEAEKPIRVFISHTWRADHKCDNDRQVAWTNTQRTVNAEEQTLLFKCMSNNYQGEVTKFAELSWFRSIAKQSKLAEPWKDGGKLKQVDEHLLVIKRNSLSRRKTKTSSFWKVEFGQCESSVESCSRIENEYGNRHMKRKTEIRHESSIERTKAYTTWHKMRLGCRSTLPNTIWDHLD